jgi:hypothetical protein
MSGIVWGIQSLPKSQIAAGLEGNPRNAAAKEFRLAAR